MNYPFISISDATGLALFAWLMGTAKVNEISPGNKRGIRSKDR